MTEHSPLPWALAGMTGIYCGDSRGSKVASTNEGHTFPHNLPFEEVAANAALIVRSVNLLPEALAALEEIQRVTFPNSKAARIARAVLQKARQP